MDKIRPRSEGLSRRTLLAGAAGVPLVAIRSRPAYAAEFTYKVATGQSLTQPINARLGEACKRIQEASSGRMELKFFPAMNLPIEKKLEFMSEILETFGEKFKVVNMRRHAELANQNTLANRISTAKQFQIG